ncbi:unnamed protein product [Durusdinium trenchii]|uniref:peptidylprolyl isomerase n=1 Tax=Durusdinium trenchii TaxID=1381693 RepID=A0ABP0L264_9DINO
MGSRAVLARLSLLLCLLIATFDTCWLCGEVRRRGLLPLLVAAWPSAANGVDKAVLDSFIYETLLPGTSGTEPRDGPVKKYAKIWLKFTGHVGNFDGPVFDSSTLRRNGQKDYVEITADLDDSFAPAMWEAVHRMKVGEQGRFVQPPSMSFGEGTMPLEGAENSDVKQIPPGSTLYYEVELVRIIRP